MLAQVQEQRSAKSNIVGQYPPGVEVITDIVHYRSKSSIPSLLTSGLFFGGMRASSEIGNT